MASVFSVKKASWSIEGQKMAKHIQGPVAVGVPELAVVPIFGEAAAPSSRKGKMNSWWLQFCMVRARG